MKNEWKPYVDIGKIMRVTIGQLVIILILTGMSYAKEGNAQAILDKNITLHIKKSGLSDILSLIEREASVKFVYSQNFINTQRKVSLEATDKKLSAVLDELFEPLQIDYEAINEQIVLRRQKKTLIERRQSSLIIESWQNAVTISGKVTSETGELLPGVNVLLKGTNNGTTTDAGGSYTLSAPDGNGTLVFSYIGYTTEEVAISNRSVIDIRLVPDIKALTEVVVVGYGTQRRQDLTGSISTVKGSDVSRLPVASVTQALQGQVAGVEIVSNSGSPGANVSVRIRGVGTVNGTDPLYVVDGLPIFGGINQINPNDIESVEVLKDASAGAIYGARAANGVIIITTKKGKEGPLQVSVDSYYGSQTPWKKLNLLNAAQYRELYTEAVTNAGGATTLPPAFNDPDRAGLDVNWQDLMLNPAPIQSHNLSLSGGGRFATFNISGGFFSQGGTLNSTRYDRANLQLNSQGNKGRFKFGESLLIAGDVNRPEPFYIGSSMFSHIVNASPLVNPINPNNNGGYGGATSTADQTQFLNAYGYTNLVSSRRRGLQLLGSMYGQYEIIKGLNYRLNVGTDLATAANETFTPTFAMGANTNTRAELRNENRNRLSWLFEHTLSYERLFGKHNFTVLGGYTEQYLKNYGFAIAGRDFPPSNNIRVLGAAGNVSEPSGSIDELRLRSYIGRVNYSFAGKYLVTATIRRDASSNFSKANRWGTFPAISVGWVVSEEEFMKSVALISFLKVRGSYGLLGNQAIGPYNYTSNVNLTTNYVLGTNQTAVPGSAPRGFPADAKWEETSQADVGVEVGFLQDKFMFVADYFQKQTSDMLLRATNIPFTTGLPDFPSVNAGGISNKGFEFALTYSNKSDGDFQYSATGNFSTYINEVTELVGNNQPLFAPAQSSVKFTKTEVGSSIGRFFGFVADGLYQSEAEIDPVFAPNAKPGDIRFRDLDGDGLLTDKDRDYIGSPLPKFSYGLSGNIAYKGFDMSMLWFGVSGNKIANSFIPAMSSFANTTTEALERWTPANTNTDIPRAVIGDPNQNSIRFSSRWIEDGSFLRLRNVTLGYTLPCTVIEKMRLTNIRLYVSGQNLLTFTKYKGYDPEVAGGSASAGFAFFESSNLVRAFDRGIFPLSRTLLGGIQIVF